LSRQGLSVALLEARSRIGGRIWTRHRRDSPVPIELGPEFVHGRNDVLFEIAREAGLLIARLPAVHAEISASGWRRSKDYWRRFEKITQKMRSSGKDRSVAEFLKSRRRMPGAQKEFVSSLIEGYDAAFLDRASEHALSTAGEPLSDPEEVAQFRVLSGYDAVAKWLWNRIDGRRRVRTLFSSPVRRIQWKRGHVAVFTDSKRVRGRRAIITLPVGVLKAPSGVPGAVDFDPEPPTVRRALQNLEMGKVVKLLLRFREPFWKESKKYEWVQSKGGEEIAFFHRADAAFPTWWSAAPAEVPMLTGWAGGPAARVLEPLPRALVLQRALETLESFFGTSRRRLERLIVAHDHHDWNADPFSRGAYSYVAVGGASSPALLARPVQDTLFFAGEATERDQSGTVPGAIASGRRAAKLILK